MKTISATLVGGSVVTGTAGATREDTHTSDRGRENGVKIVAEHDHDADEHRFELGTDEVSSGWTRLTFDNRTDHTHFAYLARLPQAAIDGADQDGMDPLDYYVEHVTRPFQWFMDDIDPEKEPDDDDLSDKYTTEDAIFPPWFGDVLPSGGAGLTAGETLSRTTVDLEPGQYIVECYVKDDDGEFHSYLGMIDLLTVTEGRSGAEPEATLDLSLSTGGLEFDRPKSSGAKTVAVHVEDQAIYDHLLGHDVHLIRMQRGTSVADVGEWMNWMDPAGLVSDGDEPARFRGGVQTILTPGLLGGEETVTAYLDVDLDPGRYAWVSEVPDPHRKELLKVFNVPCGRGKGGH